MTLRSLLLAAAFASATTVAFAAPIIVTDSAGNSFQLNDDGTYGVIVLDADGQAYSLSPDGRWKKLDEDAVAALPAPGKPADAPQAKAADKPLASTEPDGPAGADELIEEDARAPVAPPAATAKAEPPAAAAPGTNAPQANVTDEIETKLADFIKRQTGIESDEEANPVVACIMQDIDKLSKPDRDRLAVADDFETGFFGEIASERPELARNMELRIETCLNS